MDTSDGSGLILVLIFVALVLFVFFLAFKRGSKGVLGNKFLLPGAILALVVFFLLAKGTISSYYESVFKTAPYSFSELKSVVFKFGPKDSLVNEYNSASGEFKYIDKRNVLVKTQVNLTSTDLLYLHRKAAELGFWDFPSKEVNNDTTNTNGIKPVEYLIQFNYQHKSKSILFTANYDGPLQLVQANKLLIEEIQGILKGAEERQKNN
jgi:energy-coupling factor transporter transmembrane protein EcfT